ncbi:MAG: hypothetical protein JW862_12295, partial [Anaerolineales bacterium]|nr:hypothetical protein [Anaerolineales bacterium]
NKADRPGVENTERALRGMLNLAHPLQKVFRHHGQQLVVAAPADSQPDAELWLPAIQRTVATEGIGIRELGQQISLHRQYLEQSGDLQRRVRVRLQAELDNLLREALVAGWRSSPAAARYDQLLDQLVERQLSPWEAVTALVGGMS